MSGHACTCDWPPGNPVAAHRSWCPARPSGLLDGQTDRGARKAFQSLSDDLRTKYGMLDDPPKTPARVPHPAAGEAASASGGTAATPGTSPASPGAAEDVPGPDSPPPVSLGQQGGTGGGVQAWVVELPAGLRLLSLNDRIHWSVKGRITRDLRKAAFVMARNAKVPHLERARVVVEYQPPQVTRRRDTDNVATASGKPCIDGLVDARVLEDDSPRYLAEVAYRIGEPFPRGRLVLHVEAVAA